MTAVVEGSGGDAGGASELKEAVDGGSSSGAAFHDDIMASRVR